MDKDSTRKINTVEQNARNKANDASPISIFLPERTAANSFMKK